MSFQMPKNFSEFTDYVCYKGVRIPMRDGVKLYTNIFFPAKDGVVNFDKKYPVIINRTPYAYLGEIDSPTGMAKYATECGYVFVLNCCRNTYHSDGGEIYPGHDEGWGEHKDGVDTVAWLLKQPWCNGKTAIIGMSYMGGTGYTLMLAGEEPTPDTAVLEAPGVNSSDGGWVYQGEFLDTSCALGWPILLAPDQITYGHVSDETKAAVLSDNEMLGDWFSHPEKQNVSMLHMQYSLRELPISRHFAFYQRWLDNRDNPDFFSYNDVRRRKHDIDKPLLFIGSWFDIFGRNAANGYAQAVREAPTPEVARAHRLVMGPWGHSVPLEAVRDFPEADTDDRALTMEWFDQRLKGIESEFLRDKPVTLFVAGENKWRVEQTWPLPDAVPTRYYLHSEGKANTLGGNGTLSLHAPEAAEPTDTYDYNPANPIFSLGGHGVYMCGQADQRDVEKREDVLVYTSDVLTEDVEITGTVKASLFAATSATDTDFFMKVIDVLPDGTAYGVARGGRRGRYIKNGRTDPQPLTPGKVERYDMDLYIVSYVFKAGHRIRVEVCSNDILNSDTNPNAFIDLNAASKDDFVVATQTILHDAEHPSMVELPVIPASHERKWIENWPFSAAITGIDKRKSMFIPIQPAADHDLSELPIQD